MPQKLKHIFFTDDFVRRLAAVIGESRPFFDPPRFLALVFDPAWPGLELKQKMHHITLALGQTLPDDYPKALDILRDVAPAFEGFDSTVFPDFVATYGLDHFDLSMEALAFFTTLCSSEYGVRPFIDRDPERAMAYLRKWATDPNEHVRRLASEGCRPRLPWGMVLQLFRQNPSPILPVLETLKDDPSDYVRRSVANNLNDISKDHSKLVLDIGERWYGANENRDAIVKRALRTLLKKGNRRALRLFGLVEPCDVHVRSLKLDRSALAIGDALRYDLQLTVDAGEPVKVRLELRVDYVRARGKRSRKVFQIVETTLAPGVHQITRKLSFADQSTRTHHPGTHRLTVVINGVDKTSAELELRAGES